MMDRFPPPAEERVTLANWRTAPFNRWAFRHGSCPVEWCKSLASEAVSGG